MAASRLTQSAWCSCCICCKKKKKAPKTGAVDASRHSTKAEYNHGYGGGNTRKSDTQVVPPRRGKKGKGDQGQGYGGGGGGTSFFMGDDGANPTYDDDDDGLPMVMIASKRDLRFE